MPPPPLLSHENAIGASIALATNYGALSSEVELSMVDADAGSGRIFMMQDCFYQAISLLKCRIPLELPDEFVRLAVSAIPQVEGMSFVKYKQGKVNDSELRCWEAIERDVHLLGRLLRERLAPE